MIKKIVSKFLSGSGILPESEISKFVSYYTVYRRRTGILNSIKYPEIFGSAYGLHQFRMRRIELMDNPLAVAPDAQVYAEQPLHRLDEDFIRSPEYRSYQQEIQANEHAVNKTEVYSPSREAVRKACDPYLDKIRQPISFQLKYEFSLKHTYKRFSPTKSGNTKVSLTDSKGKKLRWKTSERNCLRHTTVMQSPLIL